MVLKENGDAELAVGEASIRQLAACLQDGVPGHCQGARSTSNQRTSTQGTLYHTGHRTVSFFEVLTTKHQPLLHTLQSNN